MEQVVLISGHLRAGKSGLAKLLADEYGYHWFSTSDYLRQLASMKGRGDDRASLQALGDELDAETGDSWLRTAVMGECEKLGPAAKVVVDSLRTKKQLENFRRDHRLPCVHVHLFGTLEEVQRRFASRPGFSQETLEYVKADLVKSEEDIQSFKRDADLRVNTTRNDARDTLARVAASLGLYSAPDVRCVDVLVGGQYGSEGKGHVAAYLAKEYDVLIRVGGPNAGHTVLGATGQYTYHHLPSGAKETKARLLLGPGMTVYVEDLLKEIAE
ncbi:MAG: adenylosuccinate synthetase, partial [Alcaligenaceae bacterium]